MDIALKQDETLGFDVLINGPDLQSDSGLRIAIIISLFTDRFFDSDNNLPDGTDNRCGWWADEFSSIQGDMIGSLLWLLNREKQTDQVLRRGREYALSALQWLLNDKVASQLEVEAEWVKKNTLGILVRVYKATGQPFEQMFEYSLEPV